MDKAQGVYTKNLTPPIRDRGSFRDPSGFVYHIGDEVFRAIDASCLSLVRRLERSGVLQRLERSGIVIPTRVVNREEHVHATLRRHIPQFDQFLQHERVPFVSYPYEWSTSMLADAAVCCLDLQLLLMENGYSLKDASAYNVQFTGGRPVFIDVPSIEKVRRRNVWTALHQFYRMFLYPLLMVRHHRCSLKEYFLSNLDGADLDEMYRRFGFFSAMRPSLWMDVWLPYQLQRFISHNGCNLKSAVEQDHADTQPLVLNLNRLKRKVQSLGSHPASSGRWLDYAKDNSYDEAQVTRKDSFVTGFLDRYRPERVLDVGCNTGRFAELAAGRGSAVVAVDADAACIDGLYRRSRDNGWDILPLVMDIANPSPGIGFKNTERTSFMDRSSFDCVLALALLHHLLVTARLPLESIRDLFADLTTSHLITEFVDPSDPMFICLLGARRNIYEHVSFGSFLAVFQDRFDVVSQAQLSEHRILVSFKRRS